MASARAPLVLINAVGLTPRLLAHAPRLNELAKQGWLRPLRDVVPAVTCTAQATLLTGKPPQEHGIVANGWLYRDTGEVRFWQQSNRLLQAEPLYATARRRATKQGRPFRCAKLFWWFNQWADVDVSVTPKPYYGADGNKAFGIYGTPEGLTTELEKRLGAFPFHTFWGPMAGLPFYGEDKGPSLFNFHTFWRSVAVLDCTQWIARCGAEIVRDKTPELTLIYLPHLDYEPQRSGPDGCDMPKLVRELDDACAPLLDAARALGARVWVVSEYGHISVKRPVYVNRELRQRGLLTARDGPFGETLDTFASAAFAVCDHQVAHVYVSQPAAQARAKEVLQAVPGVARVLAGDERAELDLCHDRAGELVVLSDPDAWFAYPYWLDDARAPDFARTVDIHRKPGYDPCELFFDPQLLMPKGRVIRKLLMKKLGFRTLMDVIPLDASLVKGSHGLIAPDAESGPLLIGEGLAPREGMLPMTGVRDLVLEALGFADE